MEETAKQLAERRLRELVSGALDVVGNCILEGPRRNQQVRSADAWRVINTVLELDDKQAAPEVSPFGTGKQDGTLDEVSEKLRLVKQAERRAR